MNSVMLTGDSDAATWEDWIVPVYCAHLQSTILLGSHHGAPTFFTRSDGSRYTAHLAAISPAMTVISVGDNPHGHPDAAAIRIYTAGSFGDQIAGGMKIARTDQHGSIRLVLNDDGSWKMTWTGPSPRPARAVPPRRLVPARPHTILTGLLGPSPDAPSRPIFTPPPRRSLLGDILLGTTPPPKQPSLGDILKLATPPKKKTPAEEFAEWLLKQRLWPPK